MRNLRAATLYPGIGLLEFNPVSVGRGTATPFEVVGAPFIDGTKLASELNQARLPGLHFEPIDYTPDSSTFKGQICHGVKIQITNRKEVQSVDVGITIARILLRDYPKQFQLEKFEKLVGNASTVEAIRKQENLTDIKRGWEAAGKEFRSRRNKYLLY